LQGVVFKKTPEGVFKNKIMNIFQKLILYLRQVKVESKKINWPSREKTMRYSLVVVAIATVVAIFLGGLDFIFSSGIQGLAKLFAK